MARSAVERAEQRVDDGAIDRARAVAQLADEILGRVRQLVHAAQADERRASP